MHARATDEKSQIDPESGVADCGCDVVLCK